MQYPDGREARLGDVVTLGPDCGLGVVVCSIDTDEYSEAYGREDWAYLERGVMIKFERYGLFHYVEPEPDLELVARKCG